MAETPVMERDEEKPGVFPDDDVPAPLVSLDRLDASHRVGLPTRIDCQVDSSSA
jgi:hypothetical protein